MKTELAKLIDKWEIEKGSYIPNAPIYQAFIDDSKEALERESKVNNVVFDDVKGSFSKKDMKNFASKLFILGHRGKTLDELLQEFLDNDL